MTDAERLGELLRSAREGKKLTRPRLATLTQTSTESLKGYESGHQLPAPDTYRRLTRTLRLVDDALAEADVLYARAHLPAGVLSLVHITAKAPEAYLRIGLAAADPQQKLTTAAFEDLVLRALADLHPIDRENTR